MQLRDSKAPSDHTVTLMHYVAGVIRDKFPLLLGFVHELTYLDKAAPGEKMVSSLASSSKQALELYVL